VLTCQQIVTRAVTDAGLPGYTVQGGQKLNLILAELAELYDWDILKSLNTISVLVGVNQYSLPQNYLRARQLFYFINGQQSTVNQLPLEQWNQLFQGPGQQTYPEWFASDLSPLQYDPATPPQLYLWPTPAQALSLSVKYMIQPTDYTTPESSSSIPWFPFQNYLIKRLTADLMNSSADGRKTQMLEECEAFLSKYGKLSNDQEGYAVTIPKDARRFRGAAFDSRATKALPL
jgi:hypothetical protein